MAANSGQEQALSACSLHFAHMFRQMTIFL